MNKKIILIATLLMSQNVLAINFEEAVLKAYNRSYELKAQQDDQKSLKTRLGKSYLSLLPYAQANINRAHNEQKYNNQTRLTANQEARQISVKQNLFNGGKNLFDIQRSQLIKDQGAIQLKFTEGKVIYLAAAAYINVLLNQEIKKQLDIKEQTLLQFYESTQLRFTLGEVTSTDVAQAQARLSATQAEKIAGEVNLDNARANYTNIIGEAPVNLQMVNLNFNVPASLEESLNIAKVKNFRIQSSNINIKIAKQEENIAYANLLPSVDLVGSVAKSSWQPATPRNYSRAVTLGITIPLFQQGVEYADLFDKHYQKAKIVNNYHQTYSDNIEQVHNAWTKHNMAVSQIRAAEDAVSSGQLAFDGVQEEAKMGLKTNLDVLTAEQDLYQFKVNLLNSKYKKLLSALELMNLIGKLDINFIKINKI